MRSKRARWTMGIHAAMWATTVCGLKSGTLWVLTRAALSCDDATGQLKWRTERLASACRVTVRSLDTQIRLLAGCQLLQPSDAGFRVTGWVTSEKFSENFSEKKERTKERKEMEEDDDVFNTSSSHSSNPENFSEKFYWPTWPADDAGQIRAIALTYQVSEPEAEAIWLLGTARHHAKPQARPIRSVRFFAGIVEEGKNLDAKYLEYLRCVVAEQRDPASWRRRLAVEVKMSSRSLGDDCLCQKQKT